MWRWNYLFLLIGVLFFLPAKAQDLEGTPLVNCPGYISGHPLVAEIGWSAGCFLQAIHDKNKELVVALSRETACTATAPCDGVMNKFQSEFIFGPLQKYYKKTMFEMVSKAQYIVISLSEFNQQAMVVFSPRPGKAKDVYSSWMNSFFACDFEFNYERRIWLVAGCFAASDTFFGVDRPDNVPEPIVDLENGDSDVPVLIWRPRVAKK